MTKITQIFLIVLLIFILVFSLILFFSKISKSKKVCINNNCFYAEVAENFLQQYRGLMFRKELKDDKGMFFVFDKELIYPFWMKNTKIPLDIIWINENKEIVYISEFTQICKTFFCPKINPQLKAKYVLEINAGLCQKFNIKVGDTIDIDL